MHVRFSVLGRFLTVFCRECKTSLWTPSLLVTSTQASHVLKGAARKRELISKGVFERRTSTGSEVFFILKHLDAPKFVFLSVLTIIETSCPKRWAKPLSKNEKRPLPVDVRRSKTSLLKFTIASPRVALTNSRTSYVQCCLPRICVL